MMKRILLIIIASTLCITGCGVNVNPPEVAHYINKIYSLPQSFTICQSDDWRPWDPKYYYLFPSKQGVCKEYYLERTVMILPRGTLYRIDEIRTPQIASDASESAIITIESGKAKGLQAHGDPQLLAPGWSDRYR